VVASEAQAAVPPSAVVEAQQPTVEAKGEA